MYLHCYPEILRNDLKQISFHQESNLCHYNSTSWVQTNQETAIQSLAQPSLSLQPGYNVICRVLFKYATLIPKIKGKGMKIYHIEGYFRIKKFTQVSKCQFQCLYFLKSVYFDGFISEAGIYFELFVGSSLALVICTQRYYKIFHCLTTLLFSDAYCHS